MRTLVVDDELVSRAKLEKIMVQFGVCEAAENGSMAIHAFQTARERGEPFDLVTLDISMPEMDGTMVLSAIRRIEKEAEISKDRRARVIMVTSRSEKDTVISSIQAGCDTYIVKPFNRELIKRRLEELGLDVSEVVKEKDEAGAIRASVLKIIEKFKVGEINLPVLPKVIQEIQSLTSQPTASVGDLARVIENDAVIAARLISAANSPVYRGTEKVQSVKKALNRLGFEETQSVALAIAGKSLYKTENERFKQLMERHRLYSLVSAYCAGAIAKKLGFVDLERYFFIGLVHDIGNVLLLATLGEIIPQDEAFDINEVISNVQSVHASFGAALLQRWRFEEDFIKVAKMHEGPGFHSKTDKEVLIINLASRLASHIGYGFFHDEEGNVDFSNLDSARLLQLDAETLNLIGEEMKMKIEQTRQIV